MSKKLLVLFLFFFVQFSIAQTFIKGQIIDFDTTIPIAFAKITYKGETFKADWEGKFSIYVNEFDKPLIIDYKGYYQKYAYPQNNNKLWVIRITENENEPQKEIYSEHRVDQMIKKVIEHKAQNNPETGLKSFEYKNYEHLLVTANPDSISDKVDSIIKKNIFGKRIVKLDSSNYKFKKFVKKQHIYQTEKVNLIQHNDQGTKETVLGARMAGLKRPLYEFLGLKLVSYSVYDNPFEILEIPVQNPLSKFGRNLYSFHLVDSVKIDNRKTYRIYFQPKKLKLNRLRGLLFVDAENFGIAKAYYRIYGMVNIDATYTFDYLKSHQIWFPKKRTFNVTKGSSNYDLKLFGQTIEFNSSLETEISKNASDRVYLHLESTPYDVKINEDFNISQPKIMVDVPEKSLTQKELFWQKYQKDTLDVRKHRTYTSLDSISTAGDIEYKLFLGKKIINGYLPVSIVDLDLRSLIKYNNYEGFRLGIGGVTNPRLSKKYKVAFYGAYGLKDNDYKFGITPSYLANKETETWLSASYSDDLYEIAQTTFATDSRRFKIYDPRPINISTFYNNKMASVFVESKFLTKADTYFSLSRSAITPLFYYEFANDGKLYDKYTITAAQFAIQWNPFSEYMQTSEGKIEIEKRHPKFSFQVTQTLPGSLDNDFTFTKFDFKTFYELPYLSGQKSSLLFQTGLALGDVPLTHLYNLQPNNLNRDAILQRITFAGRNSFETMYFNEFFSNEYVSLQLRHTFNKIRLGYLFSPEFSVVTRMAWGDTNHTNEHLGITYKSLNRGFFESGIEANKFFKGIGISAYFRYGSNQLAHFDDNLALKISYHLDLF